MYIQQYNVMCMVNTYICTYKHTMHKVIVIIEGLKCHNN